MTIIDAVILGLVQGLTEFLPVSSSGHLVLTQAWLGFTKNDIVFDVFAHFGTFIAVIITFRSDVSKILKTYYQGITHISHSPALYRTDPYFRLGTFLLLGSIPAAFVGLTFDKSIQHIFSNPLITSIMLIVTGLILLSTKWSKDSHNSIRLSDCIVMGAIQAFAILPGISRSGSTISAGMLHGLEKNQAARFSFLLALPAIFSATLYESSIFFQQTITWDQVKILAIGTLVAFVSGYVAILFLLDLIRKGKFSYFAYYCFLLAIIGILYFK